MAPATGQRYDGFLLSDCKSSNDGANNMAKIWCLINLKSSWRWSDLDRTSRCHKPFPQSSSLSHNKKLCDCGKENQHAPCANPTWLTYQQGGDQCEGVAIIVPTFVLPCTQLSTYPKGCWEATSSPQYSNLQFGKVAYCCQTQCTSLGLLLAPLRMSIYPAIYMMYMLIGWMGVNPFVIVKKSMYFLD